MPNTQYKDLPLTDFPDSIDSFTTYLDILASDGILIKQYMDAMNSGDIATANQILEQIPAASQKIIKATDLNKLTQAILSVERFYKTDLQPYVEDKQKEWLAVLSQFDYIGEWSAGTSYVKNNFVTYTFGGLTLLYVATGNIIPAGTPPTDTNYWRVLTIQGQQGVSGKGLAYRQVWKQIESYRPNEAVTYDGILWMALQQSTGVVPGTDNSIWRKVMQLDIATYPIQATAPMNQKQGDLWFNTQANPTKYYYLTPLDNPAIAPQIVYGHEAYDDQGRKITGTLAAPTSITINKQPDKVEYMAGETFNPAGMIVQVNYSDGSNKIVENYAYSPKTPLTAQDTTITVSYTEMEITVTATVNIKIATLTAITVITQPSKTVYSSGEVFSPAGMVVQASFSNGFTKNVQGYTFSPNTPLTEQNTVITISYSEGGVVVQTTVNITIISSILNNNSWQIIRQMSDQNKAASLWAVGDAKEITLNGTIGVATYNNLKTWVYILGFNHNAALEGNNMIHFGGFRTAQGYTATNGIALDDSYYGRGSSSLTYFSIYPIGSILTSWKECPMRTKIINSNTSNPNTAAPNTFLSALPVDLKNTMKQCTKYSNKTSEWIEAGGTAGIEGLQEWAFLLSEFEISGGTLASHNDEQNYQQQYEYYKNGNSHIKYRNSNPLEVSQYFTRSPAGRYNSWAVISQFRGISAMTAEDSRGFAPAFCV